MRGGREGGMERGEGERRNSFIVLAIVVFRYSIFSLSSGEAILG